MPSDTKQRILKAGAKIVLQKGFYDTGLAEVLKAAKVPKGSFYFYFKNKEDFGLQLVDFFAGQLKERADEFFGDPKLTFVVKIRRLFAWQAEAFEKNDYKGGCPIGNLALEMGDRNPHFRSKLDQVFAAMKKNLANLLKQAAQEGEIPKALEPEAAAEFILNSWEGALLQMKVSKSTKPHQVFDQMIFERFLCRSRSDS
jgi:TetR/AcrR family transcriptional repressor of nem operon